MNIDGSVPDVARYVSLWIDLSGCTFLSSKTSAAASIISLSICIIALALARSNLFSTIEFQINRRELNAKSNVSSRVVISWNYPRIFETTRNRVNIFHRLILWFWILSADNFWEILFLFFSESDFLFFISRVSRRICFRLEKEKQTPICTKFYNTNFKLWTFKLEADEYKLHTHNVSLLYKT